MLTCWSSDGIPVALTWPLKMLSWKSSGSSGVLSTCCPVLLAWYLQSTLCFTPWQLDVGRLVLFCMGLWIQVWFGNNKVLKRIPLSNCLSWRQSLGRARGVGKDAASQPQTRALRKETEDTRCSCLWDQSNRNGRSLKEAQVATTRSNSLEMLELQEARETQSF